MTVTDACRRACVSRASAYEARKNDPQFAEAWADVEERTTEQMEREAYRRAVDGWVERDVFDSEGIAIGQVRKFSDSLLTFMLKARRPTVYRENVRVEHSGPEGGPIETRELLGGKDTLELSPATRRKIAAALVKEAEAQAADG